MLFPFIPTDNETDKSTFSAFSGAARRLDGKTSKLSPGKSGYTLRGNSATNSPLQVRFKEQHISGTWGNTVEWTDFFFPPLPWLLVTTKSRVQEVALYPNRLLGMVAQRKETRATKPSFKPFPEKATDYNRRLWRTPHCTRFEPTRPRIALLGARSNVLLDSMRVATLLHL